MRILKQFYLFLLVMALSSSSFLFSMNEDVGIYELNDRILDMPISNGSINELTCPLELDDDSYLFYDSEDEEGYEFSLDAELKIPDDLEGTCFLFFRGVFFEKSSYANQISIIKRRCNVEKNIYSLSESDYLYEHEELLEDDSIRIREYLNGLDYKTKALFFSFYKNSYNTFLEQINNPNEGNLRKCYKVLFPIFVDLSEISKRRPVVATSEDINKALLYGFGTYRSVGGIRDIRPEYNEGQRPKYLYFGKLFVILISTSDIENINPFFVTYEYATNRYSRFDYRKVCDREVAFPGFIDGRYVVFSINLRIPSFCGEYKIYYKQKYGINYNCFNKMKVNLSNNRSYIDSIIKHIIKHMTKILGTFIINKCNHNDINVVFKGLDGTLVDELVGISNARTCRRDLEHTTINVD